MGRNNNNNNNNKKNKNKCRTWKGNRSQRRRWGFSVSGLHSPLWPGDDHGILHMSRKHRWQKSVQTENSHSLSVLNLICKIPQHSVSYKKIIVLISCTAVEYFKVMLDIKTQHC